jgi:hypothetical protein
MTAAAAVACARVRRVAAALVAASTPDAVSALLERLAEHDDAPELRAALVLLGAESVVAAAQRDRLRVPDRDVFRGRGIE